jgi:hypothetical protein
MEQQGQEPPYTIAMKKLQREQCAAMTKRSRMKLQCKRRVCQAEVQHCRCHSARAPLVQQA